MSSLLVRDHVFFCLSWLEFHLHFKLSCSLSQSVPIDLLASLTQQYGFSRDVAAATHNSCKLFDNSWYVPNFFFLISNNFIDIKKEHPSTHGVYKGSTNQTQKLQESRKSIKEGNDCFCKANNQSKKVLKRIAWGPEQNSQYLQNIYYLSPSKDTALSNEEWWTIYNHFDDDQSCLANTLTAPK